MLAMQEKPSKTETVNWLKHKEAQEWIEENKIFIGRPVRDLDAQFLAEADYHCASHDNPYMKELLIRANMLDEYKKADSAYEKEMAAQKAGDILGVLIF